MLVETKLPLVEFTDAGLHDLELGLGRLGACGGFLESGGQPGHPVVDRLHPGPGGLDPTGQPRQPFTPVGLGLHRRKVCPLGFGCRAFLLGQFRAGGLQPRPRLSQFAKQLALLLGHLLGLGIQRIGIRSSAGGGLGFQVLRPLAGDAHRRTDPLGERGEPEPGLLGGIGARRQRGHRGLVGGELFGGLRQPGGGLVVFAAQRGLDVIGAGEFRAPGHQVIGGQSQPGIAQVGLNGRRPPGHLGLAAQRLELTVQLGGQVGEPGQVG